MTTSSIIEFMGSAQFNAMSEDLKKRAINLLEIVETAKANTEIAKANAEIAKANSIAEIAKSFQGRGYSVEEINEIIQSLHRPRADNLRTRVQLEGGKI